MHGSKVDIVSCDIICFPPLSFSFFLKLMLLQKEIVTNMKPAAVNRVYLNMRYV